MKERERERERWNSVKNPPKCPLKFFLPFFWNHPILENFTLLDYKQKKKKKSNWFVNWVFEICLDSKFTIQVGSSVGFLFKLSFQLVEKSLNCCFSLLRFLFWREIILLQAETLMSPSVKNAQKRTLSITWQSRYQSHCSPGWKGKGYVSYTLCFSYHVNKIYPNCLLIPGRSHIHTFFCFAPGDI